MNTFTLLAILGALGALAAFISGARAQTRNRQVGPRGIAESVAWREVFYGAVFLAILAAPLSHGT